MSHSHRNIADVRRIRDELEKHHANPLLFFLLCLDDEAELDGLIKREISARNFFLLCNSPDARRSRWVQRERDFVLSLKDRKVHELDLDWPWEQQRWVIHEAIRSSTTFVNYELKDRRRVLPYIELLAANDFAVYDDYYDYEILMNARATGQTRVTPFVADYPTVWDMIKKTIYGYFFVFITKNWLSGRDRAHFEYYLDLTVDVPRAGLILALLDPLAPDQLPPGDFQIVDLSTGGVGENGDKLLAAAGLRSTTSGGDQKGSA